MEPADYVQMGSEAILALLRDHHAAPWLEVEARIADQAYPGFPMRVEPWPLGQARSRLVDEGVIQRTRSATRGGRSVDLWQLMEVGRKATVTEAAAARKRLLMTRYLSWASGTRTRRASIGGAGERVVHQALLKAAPYGYSLANPDGGQAATFLGDPVPIGPLDNAAVYALTAGGIPVGGVALPVEVKNVREWIYPSSNELYQLLDKAARIQAARPAVPVVPLFVCRRANITAFRQAKTLGFLITDTRRQYVPASLAGPSFDEVRLELGFLDLVPTDDYDDRILRRLLMVLPNRYEVSAAVWAVTTSELGGILAALREAEDPDERRGLLNKLRDGARDVHGLTHLGW